MLKVATSEERRGGENKDTKNTLAFNFMPLWKVKNFSIYMYYFSNKTI